MIDIRESLAAVEVARMNIKRVHPELVTPMVFEQVRQSFLDILNGHERLLYQLKEVATYNDILLAACRERVSDG